ncbi:MAG TPA: hypothetical protein PLV42_07490 [bacterium]|nr:hypothetical protein [bacterium]
MKNTIRLATMLCALLMAGTLCAKSLVVFPTAWKKGTEKEFAEGLDENFQLMIDKVKGAEASGPDALSADIKKQLKKCDGKVACIERAAKDQTDFDLALLLSYQKGKIEITIFNKKGRKVAEGAVDVEEEDEPEDVAGGVLGSTNKLIGKIKDEPEEETSSSDEMSSSSDQPAKKLSSSEKKEVMRKGFKSYQTANYKDAVNSFRAADETDLGDTTDDIRKLMEKAKEAIKSEDWAAALDNLDRAAEKDDKIRQAGYKAIVFTKESNERWKYNETADDGTNFRKMFKDFKGEIGDHKKWKEDALRKLEDELGATAKLKDTITRKFEADEKDFRRKEKEYEEKNAADIKSAQADLEGGLDEKYEKKIKVLDNKINKKTEQYGNDKGYEESYKDAIDQELKALDKKYENMRKAAEKEKSDTLKGQEKASRQLEKDTEKQIADLEGKSKDVEKQLEAMNKEIEKDNAKFDKAEQKLQEERDKGVGKDEAADRLDIEKAEKDAQKKTEELNAQTAEFDKKDEAETKSLEKVQQEIDQFLEKQEQRLSKVQEKVDKEREKIDKDADAKRRQAEETGDKEFEKQAQKLQKDVEAVEADMRKFEEKYNNYEKKTDYKDLQKKLAAANKTLQNFEKGREAFIKSKTDPVDKEIATLNKDLESSFKDTKGKIEKETADFKAKKEGEKKEIEKRLSAIQKQKKDFQKKFDALQKSIEAERNRKVKEIEGRQKVREEQFAAESKKRRAAFEAEQEKKRKSLAALEKQMNDSAKQGDKLREGLAKKIEQLKMDAEKKVQKIEEDSVKKAQNMEIQQEKERKAVYAKYEGLYKQDRAKLEKEMKGLEAEMKGLIKERDNEQTRLKMLIEKLEKDIVLKRDEWEKNAKSRQGAFEGELAKAGAKEAAAKKEYDKRKAQIERDFLARLDGTAKKMIDKTATSSKKEYEIERSRDVEATGVTKEINALRVQVYVNRALGKLKDGDFKEARKLLYKGAYYDKENKQVKDGFAEVLKTAGAMFAEASRLMADDPEQAKTILRKLTANLSSTDEYYIKAKFLLLDEE